MPDEHAEPIHIAALEQAFIAARTAPPDLPGAFRRAFGSLGPALPPALLQAGLGVAHAMDRRAAHTPEPRYHDRHHAAEATRAMAALCRRAMADGLLTVQEAACGVVAMVGHDMGHDGSTTSGGVLEARSHDAVMPLLQAAGASPAQAGVIGDIIHGTNPAHVAGNAARAAGHLPPGARGPGQNMLRALANDADIAASVTPTLGPRLGLLLAEEWMLSGGPGWSHVGTASGRLAFLLGYPAFGAPARALGLCVARSRCLAAYAEAGRALDGIPTPEAGCAALDRLGPRAGIAYAAALAATTVPVPRD